MKKNLLSVALTLACSLMVHGQTFDWAAQFGGNTYEAGKAIATDANGNVYSAGYFYGTSDFDPGAGTLNFTSYLLSASDVYISKLDASGNLAWAKQIGGAGNDVVNGIAVNEVTGDVYITGWFSDTVDFDPGAGSFIVESPGIQALYILKLDAAGNFVWAKTLTDGVGSYGYALAFDAAENVYVCGEFDGTIDFDPGAGTQNATAAANSDAFILKLDASGNYLMDIEFGGTGYDEIFDIELDGSGNIYVAGAFDGTTDLDPGVGTTSYVADGIDIFVSKFDAAGNLTWGQHMGGTGNEQGFGLGIDGSGNVYTTGVFTGTVDFDPGAGGTSYTADGFSDAFLTRLDASGSLVWAAKIGGSGLDRGTALTIAADGGIVWTGGFQDTIDVETGSGVTNLNSAGATDIFVAKFNSNASLTWAKSMGGTDTDWGYAIDLDANDNVYLTGQIRGTADLDPNAGTANFTSFGESDIYVLKLSVLTGINENGIGENGISLFPNPTHSLFQIHVSQATELAIFNVLGQELTRLEVQNQVAVDVSGFDAGVYFLKDLNTGRAIKFIKE